MALDHQVIFEVFSFLPAKPICRFRAVSKECSKFISEDYFIMQQSLRLQLRNDDGFFIQKEYCWDEIELHAALCAQDDNGKSLEFGVPDGSLRFLKQSARILSSNNGLMVCLNRKDENVDLFLFNPATQNLFVLPTRPNHPETIGFKNCSYLIGAIVVFDNQTKFPDDYRVMVIERFESSLGWSSNTTCYIYCSKGHSWKQMEAFYTGTRNMRLDMPVYSDGMLYLISDSFPYVKRESPFYKPYIVAYDIENGTSWFITLPKEATKGADDTSCDMRIFQWDKVWTSSPASSPICLIRLRGSVFTGWILHDDWSWTRILKVRVRTKLLMDQDPNPIICGFTVINGDSLVFATQHKIYQCRLALPAPTAPNGSQGRRIQFEERCCHRFGSSINMQFHAYANSLRPCGSGGTSLYLNN